jgi:ectoine hydroxylase-related dioxygenase (phytanoyl-CoA dioxygenase family)
MEVAMPPIRTDLALAEQDLVETGLALIGGAASPEQIEVARTRLIEQAAGEDAAGCAFRERGDTFRNQAGAVNQRIWNLINKGEIFRAFAVNAVVRRLVGRVLGPDFLLFSSTANIVRQGGRPQFLHGDQVFAPVETPYPLLANTMWMLSDFTPENGATRVVPGSHLAKRWPGPGETIESFPATGPAGTLMVWDGRLWHGTGPSRASEPRLGLLTAYCAPFLRQQENSTVSVSPEVLAHCSDDLRTLLGFRSWAGMGSIDGADNGVLRDRPTRYSGALTTDGTPSQA